MNAYEQKQADRRKRMESKAASLRAQSNAAVDTARQKASVIPFGQPILVGHHSEGRDRRYRESINRTMGKAVDLDKKADYYESKAAGVGTGGISSDDPDAIQKLETKLQGLQALQEKMKKANRLIRKEDKEGLREMGFTDADVIGLLKPDFAGRVGYPTYALSNNNANIRRIKDRIAELKQAAEREEVDATGNGYRYKEDREDNRCQFYFDDKPSEEVRDLLKRHSFRWSPKREGQPWVRKISTGAVYAAATIRKTLDAQD